MIPWLDIGGRLIYANAAALAYLDPARSRRELLLSLGTLRAGIEGETPNISVTLRNDAGQCGALFAAAPPIGSPCELHCAGGRLFAGTVAGIRLGAECTLEIVA